jgi:hypothetical protein
MSHDDEDEDDEKSHIGVQVPIELKKEIRGKAGRKDMSMSEFLRETLEEAV